MASEMTLTRREKAELAAVLGTAGAVNIALYVNAALGGAPGRVFVAVQLTVFAMLGAACAANALRTRWQKR